MIYLVLFAQIIYGNNTISILGSVIIYWGGGGGGGGRRREMFFLVNILLIQPLKVKKIVQQSQISIKRNRYTHPWPKTVRKDTI